MTRNRLHCRKEMQVKDSPWPSWMSIPQAERAGEGELMERKRWKSNLGLSRQAS